MEENEMAKVWFVNRGGNRLGPVSLDDLKSMVERGELNPRLDMVWKDGMDKWIAAGELEGLFERNEEAKAAEQAKGNSNNFTGYIPQETDEERDRIKGIWPGVGRGTFFFVCYLLPVIWVLAIRFGFPYLEGKASADDLLIVSSLLLLFPFLLMVATTLKRFQNLGMSRLWFLGLFVPILGIWVYYRVIACPPGYAQNKKLDGMGWVLAIFYWLSSLAMIAGIAGLAYYSAKNPEKFNKFATGKEMQQLDEYWERAKERGEKILANEDDEKTSPEPKDNTY